MFSSYLDTDIINVSHKAVTSDLTFVYLDDLGTKTFRKNVVILGKILLTWEVSGLSSEI